MSETIKQGERFYVSKTKSFKHNDLVVFHYYGNDYSSPVDYETGQWKQHWEERVFRLVAMSGDNIQIRNDTVILNGKTLPFPEGARLSYRISARSDISALLPEEEYLPDVYNSLNRDTITCSSLITQQYAESLQKNEEVYSVVRNFPSYEGVADSAFARNGETDKWNPVNYGPLYIPKPGETIVITDINRKLYRSITDTADGPFVVKEKLYFVLGDNRHAAQDSRYIGFISHSNIFGVVK
jgi:signal peptidase I